MQIGIRLFFKLLHTVGTRSFSAVLAELPGLLAGFPPLAFARDGAVTTQQSSRRGGGGTSAAASTKSRAGDESATSPSHQLINKPHKADSAGEMLECRACSVCVALTPPPPPPAQMSLDLLLTTPFESPTLLVLPMPCARRWSR